MAMRYLPNPVFVEEKGAFSILSGPGNIILPAAGMALSKQQAVSVCIADTDSRLSEELGVFHCRMKSIPCRTKNDIPKLLRDNKAPLVIAGYSTAIFSEETEEAKATGALLKSLAKENNATYLLLARRFDETLHVLAEYADRVLIVEDEGRDKEEDFVFISKNSGCYIKRQRKISDFS